jgi:hypothetical protein
VVVTQAGPDTVRDPNPSPPGLPPLVGRADRTTTGKKVNSTMITMKMDAICYTIHLDAYIYAA